MLHLFPIVSSTTDKENMKTATRLLGVFILLALIFSPSGVTPAYASTIIVTNDNDSGAGSLRDAIASASNGDTITFDNDYTITLASQLEIINKTITITGEGHHITISGNNAVRVFYVGQSGGSGNLTLNHLNIVNGKSTVEECAGSEVACGGGLMLEYLTTATVMNSTFSNNDGGLVGGAIYSYYGNPLTVINSVFIGNQADAYAGAIQIFYGNATLTNNTFTGNMVTLPGGYGGAILNNWGIVTFRNNIFANNSAGNGGNCNNSGGTFNDGGGNLVWGDTSHCPGVNANPRLGTLENYGGDVPTIPLLPGSAAINAASANCPDTDTRGVTRTATCDSGAFESQGFTLTKTSGDNQSTAYNTAFPTPLALNVTSAFGEPVDGGVVTLTAPSTGASLATTSYQLTIASGAVAQSVSSNSVIGGPYNVTASATGASSLDFSLTNVSASPTDIQLSAASINENLPVGTEVGTITAADPDAGDTHSYSFCGGADDASFAIAGDSLNAAAIFDYETKNSYAICIHADDGNGGTFNKNFTITVNNVTESASVIIHSTGAQDGWILEATETSNTGGTMNAIPTTLRLGDDKAKKQYRSILSFATGAAIPDNATITKATLKVKRQAVLGGGNPVTMFQGFMMDIRKGVFSTSELQPIDWQAASNQTYGPFNTPLVGGWYSIDLTTGKAYINKMATLSGLTQIRLRFQLDDNNNAIANYLSLYSGDAATANRPQLVIEYNVP